MRRRYFTALPAFLRDHLSFLGWIGIITALIGARMIACRGNERLAIDVGAILVLSAAGTWSLNFLGQRMLLARYGARDLMMPYVIWSGTLILTHDLDPLPPLQRRLYDHPASRRRFLPVYLRTFATLVSPTWLGPRCFRRCRCPWQRVRFTLDRLLDGKPETGPQTRALKKGS